MAKKNGMGSHQGAVMKSDEWLTPPEIIQACGKFDLDPCAPVYRPWPMADQHFTIVDNGLLQQWFGRVWMNSPYGNMLSAWLHKLADHGNGVALTFARTETDAFQKYVFPKAESILFIKGRLNFYTVAGTRAKMNAGAPSVLISYGEENSEALERSGIKGKHVPLRSAPMIVIGIAPSWKMVVTIAMKRLDGEAHLEAIYEMVERIAPDKIHHNKHYKEKVRQTLQLNFNRIKKGTYEINLSN